MSNTPQGSGRGDLLGVHYAVRIFISTTILWAILRLWADVSPIWAISSMIAVSDPNVSGALQTFWGRITNAMLGCITGLAFLALGSGHDWKLPFALATSVLLSAYVVRIPVMWRQAPITAAIVIAGGLSHHSKRAGMEDGVMRVGEVMLGCVVGLAVTWAMHTIWPPKAEAKEAPQP